MLGLALLIGACGGGGAGDDGPVSVVPADAVLYFEATVRPEGSLGDDARDAAGRLFSPGELEQLLVSGFEMSDVEYARDVEPWLGERVGYWLRPTQAKDNGGAVLLEASDEDAARDMLESRGEARSHEGAEYWVSDDGYAAALVEGFVVVGREAEVRRTIETAGEDSLAETDRFDDAVGGLEGERLALAWTDLRGLLESVRETDPASYDALARVVDVERLPALAAAFRADGSRLELELKTRDAGSLDGWLLGEGTPLMAELPGDAWLALGAADLGESVRKQVDAYAGALGSVAVRRMLEQRFGLDLDRDLTDWMGDAAAFVRGTDEGSLDFGLVIESVDVERSTAAFGKLVGVAQRWTGSPRPPRPVDVEGADQAFALDMLAVRKAPVLARGSGRVVIAAGVDAASAALGAGKRLGDGELYGRAEELVGMEPSMLVGMRSLLALGAAAETDPDFEAARPYLEAFELFAAGAVVDGDETTVRVAGGFE